MSAKQVATAPRTEGLNPLDRDRAGSLADEGGTAGARVESPVRPGLRPVDDISTVETLALGERPDKPRKPQTQEKPIEKPRATHESMLFELSILPLGGDTHLSDELARIVDVIAASGLPYRLGPSSTAIEGSWDEVMPVIRACHDKARETSRHVFTLLQIEDDGGQTNKLRRNVEAVREKEKELP